MGRNSVKQNHQNVKESLSAKYSTGLNYLLSNQQDKAIEHLIETLAVEDDTVEAHFAMANLFRRRGELDRALKVHEHLVRQKHLPDSDKERAVYELGKDFHSAGLYDRAEEMFMRIHKSNSFGIRAINFLLHIYQQTKDWRKGIELQKTIQKTQDKKLLHTLANFYCEQAVIAREGNEYIDVLELLEMALSLDPNSSRTIWLMAQLYENNQQYIEAIKCYQQIYEKDTDFFPDVIDAMEACYLNLGDEKAFYQFIKSAYESTLCTSSLIKYLTYVEKYHGKNRAKEVVLSALKRRPTIRGFDHFVMVENSDDENDNLSVIKELIATYISLRPRYSCRSCGFNSSVHYWACPSCHEWEQLKPVKGLEGE